MDTGQARAERVGGTRVWDSNPYENFFDTGNDAHPRPNNNNRKHASCKNIVHCARNVGACRERENMVCM